MLRIVLFSVSVLLASFNAAYGNDTGSALVPFDYATHGKETLKLVQENFDLLGTMPPKDTEKYAEKAKYFSEKFDAYSHNGYHMSSGTKIIKDSMRRIVLMNQSGVVGLVSFFIKADEKTGYIEELCSRPPNHQPYFETLISYALVQLQKSKVPTVSAHLCNSDQVGQAIFSSLDFQSKSQNDEEKEAEMIPFEYNCPSAYTTTVQPAITMSDSSPCPDPFDLIIFHIPEPLFSLPQLKNAYIAPFEYDHHLEEARQVSEENTDLMCQLPSDPEERKKTLERLHKKGDAVMYNGYIMSTTKIVEDSMKRIVLIDQGKVKGLMDFYIRAEDNKGYIETLCTSPRNHNLFQKALILHARSQLQQKGVKHTVSHVFATDLDGQAPFKELGFKVRPQDTIEKDANAFALEYTYPTEAQQ